MIQIVNRIRVEHAKTTGANSNRGDGGYDRTDRSRSRWPRDDRFDRRDRYNRTDRHTSRNDGKIELYEMKKLKREFLKLVLQIEEFLHDKVSK